MSTLNPALEKFVVDTIMSASDTLPDHRIVCAIVRPNGSLAVAHNLEDRNLAPAILRQLADKMEQDARQTDE
jgi:hypothetical protein